MLIFKLFSSNNLQYCDLLCFSHLQQILLHLTKQLVFQVKFSLIVFYLESFTESYFLDFNNLQSCNSIFLLYLFLYIFNLMKYSAILQVIIS